MKNQIGILLDEKFKINEENSKQITEKLIAEIKELKLQLSSLQNQPKVVDDIPQPQVEISDESQKPKETSTNVQKKPIKQSIPVSTPKKVVVKKPIEKALPKKI